MGFLRKSILIGTGGLAPIKAKSYRERTAKATEQQLKLMRQQQAAAAPRYNVSCPHCHKALVAPAGTVRCVRCRKMITVTPKTAAPPANVGVSAELELIASLHQSGALTDAEFAQAKQRILGSS